MKHYFEEKSSQIDIDSMTAFGIPISTRYSKADELIEMISFCRECAKYNINKYVKSVFYDSKANLCTFELDTSVKKYSKLGRKLREIADKTIEQHALFDSVGGKHNGEFPSDQNISIKEIVDFLLYSLTPSDKEIISQFEIYNLCDLKEIDFGKELRQKYYIFSDTHLRIANMGKITTDKCFDAVIKALWDELNFDD